MVAWLVVAAPAREQAPTPVLDLEWRAPAGCPTAEEIRDRVEAVLGRAFPPQSDRVLSVHGSITRTGGSQWRLALTMADGGDADERSFEADTCDALREPAAVVIAVAADPYLDMPPAAKTDALVPSPPASKAPASVVTTRKQEPEAVRARPEPAEGGELRRRPSPAAEPTESSARSARPRPKLRFTAGVAGGLALGNLPGVGGVLLPSLGLLAPRVRFDLGVAHLFRRRRAYQSGAGASLGVTAVRPELCWRAGRGALRLPVCGGVEVGILRGSGYGVVDGQARRHVWAAGLVGAGITWAVHSRVALRARGELAIHATRREFTIAGDAVFTTRAVGGRLLAGLEVRLP